MVDKDSVAALTREPAGTTPLDRWTETAVCDQLNAESGFSDYRMKESIWRAVDRGAPARRDVERLCDSFGLN